MKLPEGDRTPEDFFLYKPTWIEYIKRPLRAIIYPLLTAYRDWHLENKYGFKKN